MNRALTVAQVAMICGVKPATVRGWLLRGHITRNRYGRIDPAEMLRYLDERGTRGQHKAARQRGYRLPRDGQS